jgi:hypothetical protein
MKPMRSFRLHVPKRSSKDRTRDSKTGARWNGTIVAIGSIAMFWIATAQLISRPRDMRLWLLLVLECVLGLIVGVAAVIWGRKP